MAKAIKMYTFTKEERLCNKRLLDQLFHSGSSFLLYPFRLVWLQQETQEFPVQVVINVPKRNFKHATDRNLLKRRIREAYRLNKDEFLYSFLKSKESYIILSINYIGKEIADYTQITKKLIASLEKLKIEHDKSIVG
jgi:ribonuclease P protein component